MQQWLGDNPEEEEEDSGNPCPVCNSAEREDILLLCDSCDAAYHTSCIGLDHIPDGDWFCMECAHLFHLTDESQSPDARELSPRRQIVRRPQPRDVRGLHVRTRARMRRARRQARDFEWQGAWGQFSGRFYEMSDLDLDNHDDEDEDLEQYRRFQQIDRRELQRWQQRMDIANRLGARDAFANNIPPEISEQLQPGSGTVPTGRSRPMPQPVAEESREERRAWGAFDRARETEDTSVTSRKRKVRSVSASPAEPSQQPERKLKRPRTRRLPTQGEASGSASSPASAVPAVRAVTTPAAINGTNGRVGNAQPLVSTLLKELEPNAASEDDEHQTVMQEWRLPPEASSPALSPSPSTHSSPRALSLTPPPLPTINGRPTSPTLSLSTHIEPKYPPANYSPNRYSSDHSDSEQSSDKLEGRALEIRQPQPRRPRRVPERADMSPTRSTMSQEDKKSINEIVKGALRPHWRAQKLTTEQYAIINRDVSRKLYEEVKDASSLDAESRRSWQRRATHEVAQAVAELQA